MRNKHDELVARMLSLMEEFEKLDPLKHFDREMAILEEINFILSRLETLK